MRFGVSIPNMGDPEALVELAAAADGAGWHGVFLWDHVVFVESARLDLHDPWTLLGAMATRTSTVRLGTLVTPLPRRRPWNVAKAVTTLDHLSGGRAVLGVGLGFPPDDEYARFGEAAGDRDRAARLDRALDLVRDVWTGDPVDALDGMALRPPPVQRPHPPVWVAAMSEPARRRAARWDGVVPLLPADDGITLLRPEDVADLVADHHPGGAWDVVVGLHWEEQPADYDAAGATWGTVSRDPWDPGWYDDLRAEVEAGPPAV